MSMRFRENIVEVLLAVAPITLIVVLLQVSVIHMSTVLFVKFLIGAILVTIGLLLFLQGVKIGLLPMGEMIGAELPKRAGLPLIHLSGLLPEASTAIRIEPTQRPGPVFSGARALSPGGEGRFLPCWNENGGNPRGGAHRWILVPIGFSLGFVATIAEPAVRILSFEFEKTSSGPIRAKTIVMTLAIGVVFFVALGMFRILLGIPIHYFIVPGYLIALWFAQRACEGLKALSAETSPLPVVKCEVHSACMKLISCRTSDLPLSPPPPSLFLPRP